jgi:hypothetical protein
MLKHTTYEHTIQYMLYNIELRIKIWEPSKFSQYSAWLQTARPEFDPRQREIFLSVASVSRPALRPTQPPIQMHTGVRFPGGKVQPGSDADHSLPSSTDVKNK